MVDNQSSDVVRGTRFSGGPARGFLSSLPADERIFRADLAVDRAHVVMLAEQDIITNAAAGEILEAVAQVETDGFQALSGGEDVHAAIETRVIDIAGDAGRRLHTARSRNDEVATCLRYQLRDEVLTTIAATIGFRSTLHRVAREELNSVMPGYTHLQPAQPTTVAHWLLSYAGAATRDCDRLFDAFDRINHSPLGAGAFAGTPFPIDRERTAALLGFDQVIENAMDAVAARDFLVETAAAIAGLATTLAGLAADVIHFSNRGYLDLDSDYASTSSIMPQKVNPDSIELVRATTGDAVASLTGILTTLKGLPRAYNRDLQRATPHIWSSVDAVTEATDVLTGAIETASWNTETLETAALDGFAAATGVADTLTMHGVPFRTAHEIVAKAAEHGSDMAAIHVAVETVLDEPLEAVCEPAAIEASLDPRNSVTMRNSLGGPAPETVDPAIDRSADTLATDRTRLDTTQSALEEASTVLDDAITTYQ